MIDTIKIAHIVPVMPAPDELRRIGWQMLFNKFNGRLEGWFYKEKDGSKYPFLSLFTAPDGINYLSVRISMPAFILGTNATLINQEQVERGLNLLSQYVSERSPFTFDAKTALVWEVHFTKDYFIGEDLMQFALQNLKQMEIPRFEAGLFAKSTIYFHSKGSGKIKEKPRTICIYSKFIDCLNKSFPADDTKAAKGALRLEFRYKTPDSVKRMVKTLKLPNNEAQTVLNQDVSNFILHPIERQILLIMENTGCLERITKLAVSSSKRHAASLIQFLVYLNFYGKNFYKLEFLGFSRTSYYARQKECREIGVPSLFEHSKQVLQVDALP